MEACHCSVRWKQSKSVELVTHLADQILCVPWRFHLSLVLSFSPFLISLPAFHTFVYDHLGVNIFSSLSWEKQISVSQKKFSLFSEQQWHLIFCIRIWIHLLSETTSSWSGLQWIMWWKVENSLQIRLHFIAGHHERISLSQNTYLLVNCERKPEN